MNLVSKTYWGTMPFWFRRPPPAASSASLALRTEDFRQVRALYWTQNGATPRIAVVVMHPRVDFHHHYCIPRLVAAGFGVLAANSRYVNNDTACEHEHLLYDVDACVRWLRTKASVEHVVLLGNSGGGSLMAFYQAQAKQPADGLALVAAHRGQGHVLLHAIDAAVVDELDPSRTDSSLDIYDVRNGFREPPEVARFEPSFVERVRAAQVARVRRIDERARAILAEHESATAESEGSGFAARPFPERQAVLQRRAHEPVMVIYRTMANPAYVDPTVDADPQAAREYGSLLSDRPDLMNRALLGFARTCTARAWLSTWSGLSSRADLVKNIASVSVPTLVVHATSDREVYFERDVKPVFDASAARDKQLVRIDRARHYFEPDFGDKETPDVDRLMDVVVPWIRERFA